MSLSPYLQFKGNCQEALNYYVKHLGAKIEMSFPYSGAPSQEHTPADWGNKIMHASCTIMGSSVMASDCAPQYFSKPQGISLSLALKDLAEAERIFNALSDKGQVTMPLQKTFWARAFGMCTDQFGIPWMVNCE